jgi:hypothetical protein
MEDDDTAGLGTARVDDIVGSGRTTLLQAREQHQGLGDGTCIIDGVTDSGWGR